MEILRTIPREAREGTPDLEEGSLPRISSGPNYGLDFSAHLYANVSPYVHPNVA
ncbi:hypothetical protein MRY87_06040 [bacterium]|nr:hypothetical protein [bacterium]